MLISHDAIILVIDGSRMMFLRNHGHDSAAALELLDPAALPGAAAPRGPRSAHKSPDFHQAGEDAFAIAATETLNGLARNANRDFIVIAAPHVLGVMRLHYSPDLARHLVAEIARDYAGRPVADIATLLRLHAS
jgi:protein required for attachment to host cells